MTHTDENTGIEILYRGRTLRNIAMPAAVVQQFNAAAFDLDLEELCTDIGTSQEFVIPQQYKDIDVESYIKNLIPHSEDQTDKLERLSRVEEELDLFQTRNLFPVLQLLIYIVDTMRKNNIVWGVGRGSSVASYCLYLIGVHKIDSLHYKLEIKEFLKD